MIDDSVWLELERLGRLSGHVLCRCPACGERQLVAYRPKSQPWPVCHLCCPEHLRVKSRSHPRVVPIGDVALVRKNPGKPRTRRQLIEDHGEPTRKPSRARARRGVRSGTSRQRTAEPERAVIDIDDPTTRPITRSRDGASRRHHVNDDDDPTGSPSADADASPNASGDSCTTPADDATERAVR